MIKPSPITTSGDQPLSAQRWNMLKKIALLFITIYCSFLVSHFFNRQLHFVATFWDWAVILTGKYIPGLTTPISIKPNGSGDTTYNYVMQLLWVMLALIIAIIWAVLDRKRTSYRQLYYWLRIVIRYYFAYILIAYGFVKIIKIQFPYPDLYKLAAPFGDSSPMGLAWSFIGYSKAYNFFTGTAEFLAGFLLVFRRTTLLGALIGLTIMTNVAAINLCYDVPVKIFSLNLVFIALFLISHDAKRLYAFFFEQRALPSVTLVQPPRPRRVKALQLSLKILFILLTFYSNFWSDLNISKQYGDNREKPPLYGIYDTEQFSAAGTAFSSPISDSYRWKKLIIDFPGSARIITKADSISDITCKVDTLQKTVNITSDYDGKYELTYTEPDKDHLLFTGIIRGDSVHITMKRFDLNKFALIKGHFRWINEYPDNR